MVARLSSKSLESHSAALSLGAFGETAVAPLINAIQSANPRARYRASEALGHIGVPAVRPLIDVLGNRSQDVRCAAAQALGGIGSEAAEAAPKLTRLLSTNVATVHKSDDDGDLLRIFRVVANGYRLAREFEDKRGDGPFSSGYAPPEAFRLGGELIHSRDASDLRDRQFSRGHNSLGRA
jgi:hypothetical protein